MNTSSQAFPGNVDRKRGIATCCIIGASQLHRVDSPTRLAHPSPQVHTQSHLELIPLLRQPSAESSVSFFEKDHHHPKAIGQSFCRISASSNSWADRFSLASLDVTGFGSNMFPTGTAKQLLECHMAWSQLGGSPRAAPEESDIHGGPPGRVRVLVNHHSVPGCIIYSIF